MGFVAAILFKGLGFGQRLLGWIWDTICGIFKFAITKPFQFLTLALGATLIWAGWYGLDTKKQLVATQKIVEQKTIFIKEQDKVLKEYVRVLDVEKKNHVQDIRKSNNAVASLKTAADAALARAQAAGKAAEKNKVQYQNLAEKYSQANVSSGTADERIKREEQTTDAFFKDWRKAK